MTKQKRACKLCECWDQTSDRARDICLIDQGLCRFDGPKDLVDSVNDEIYWKRTEADDYCVMNFIPKGSDKCESQSKKR
jgi:hypothetical protein